jgi:hypothetical protein
LVLMSECINRTGDRVAELSSVFEVLTENARSVKAPDIARLFSAYADTEALQRQLRRAKKRLRDWNVVSISARFDSPPYIVTLHRGIGSIDRKFWSDAPTNMINFLLAHGGKLKEPQPARYRVISVAIDHEWDMSGVPKRGRPPRKGAPVSLDEGGTLKIPNKKQIREWAQFNI